MALKPQSVKKPVMSFGEHRDISQVLSTTQKKDKRVQVVMDEDLHTLFKITCAKNGTNISAVVTELIKDWIAKNE